MNAPSRPPASPAGQPLDLAAKRKIVFGVMLAMFLATLDSTIVAPALPTIGAALGGENFYPGLSRPISSPRPR